MHTAFSFDKYTIKPRGLSIAGKFRAFDPQGQAVLFSEQKSHWSTPFTTIHVFIDEKKEQEVLLIQDSKHEEKEEVYDVIDGAAGEKVGSIGADWSNWFGDAWWIADSQGNVIARIRGKSTGRSILNELSEGVVPQILNILVGDARVAEFRQKSVMIGHHLLVDFSMDTGKLDRRLGLAAAFLIAGHQSMEAD